jgi:trehalose-phosphatase
MEYLFDCWQKIKDELDNKFIFLLLDYDGTLTPIVETPGQAFIPEETKTMLDRIVANSHCGVAIISGRSLSDLRSIVGLSEIIYVGNHGLEIEGPKIRFESRISPNSKSVIRHIADEIKIRLAKINGVLVEDKGLTISAHYRLVDAKNIQEFLSIFHEITEPYLDRKQIRITSGKKVYEVRPPVVWDKGKVVLWLLARQQFMTGEKSVFPVYIGDDVTDEDAFKALQNKGLTIFIGEGGNSQAQYYLKSSDEVTVFLHRLLESKKE